MRGILKRNLILRNTQEKKKRINNKENNEEITKKKITLTTDRSKILEQKQKIVC